MLCSYKISVSFWMWNIIIYFCVFFSFFVCVCAFFYFVCCLFIYLAFSFILSLSFFNYYYIVFSSLPSFILLTLSQNLFHPHRQKKKRFPHSSPSKPTHSRPPPFSQPPSSPSPRPPPHLPFFLLLPFHPSNVKQRDIQQIFIY